MVLWNPEKKKTSKLDLKCARICGIVFSNCSALSHTSSYSFPHLVFSSSLHLFLFCEDSKKICSRVAHSTSKISKCVSSSTAKRLTIWWPKWSDLYRDLEAKKDRSIPILRHCVFCPHTNWKENQHWKVVVPDAVIVFQGWVFEQEEVIFGEV